MTRAILDGPDGLVDSEADVEGIRCRTHWCVARDDPRKSCGDVQGEYAGLTHRNRAARARRGLRAPK